MMATFTVKKELVCGNGTGVGKGKQRMQGIKLQMPPSVLPLPCCFGLEWPVKPRTPVLESA